MATTQLFFRRPLLHFAAFLQQILYLFSIYLFKRDRVDHQHNVDAEEKNKVALSAEDDKPEMTACIHTLALGHL